MTVREAYEIAIAADHVFQQELVRCYGSKRAAEMRYRPSEWHDIALVQSGRTKERADHQLLTLMRAASA